jgi:hypothetical protein
MTAPRVPFLKRIIEKLHKSWSFSISLLAHIITVTIFGTTVLFKVSQEPPDFQNAESEAFVATSEPTATVPQQQPTEAMPPAPNITMTAAPANPQLFNAITTSAAAQANFSFNPMVMAAPNPTAATPNIEMSAGPKPGVTPFISPVLSKADAKAIMEFSSDWAKKDTGGGTRVREFVFTAYIGEYSGGNWDSTVKFTGDAQGKKKIQSGSLPNLLNFIKNRSNDRVKTNHAKVESIKLDSDELFKKKPPFLFLTGSKDFKLSETEVENLRKYVRLGGAIWGDSTVPGRNSRFDIAFRREMRRIIPDKDKDWEEIPKNHPIFDEKTIYFPEVNRVPAGINYYQEPVYTLKIFDEIAIIYTANDYGDMWQVGLRPDGTIDASKNKEDQFVALNSKIWSPGSPNNNTYLRNISPESLELTYKFGTNMVIHLLTRWEAKIKSAGVL